MKNKTPTDTKPKGSSPLDREALIKEGHYFYYKEKGYIAPNYPLKKSPLEVKNIEEGSKNLDSDSGKVNP
jgi:hypothetical protein